MINNKLFKIVSYTLIFMICFGVCSTTFATLSTPETEVAEATTHLSEDNGQDDVYKTLRQITNILTIFAFMICTFKLAQIGFKFMFGVANKRSDAMQSLLPWALGTFICAMWLVIGNWIITLITQGGIAGDGGPFSLPTWLGF